MLSAIVLMAATLSEPNEGPLEILSHQEQLFENTDCKPRKTCNLKSIRFITEDYREFAFGAWIYGTRMFARYDVQERKDLEKYIFVQFLRGYVYEVRQIDGLRNLMGYDHMHFGQKDLWWHGKWSIDTDSFDPAYSSSLGYKSRFAILHWNKNENSFDRESEMSHAEKPSPYTHAYIWDRPSQAFKMNDLPASGNIARNVEMEFVTCMYKTKDVPKKISRTDLLENKEPIACFNWTNVWYWSFHDQDFVRWHQIIYPPPLAPEYQE